MQDGHGPRSLLRRGYNLAVSAQRAGKVIGVEIVEQAILNAKFNARLNGIENAEFFRETRKSCCPPYWNRKQSTQ